MHYKILPMDIESYPNYLLVGIKDTKGIYYMIDNADELHKFMPYLNKIVFGGYNSINYDSVIFDYIINNYTKQSWDEMTKICNRITKEIIQDNESHFSIRKKYKIPKITYNLDVSYYCSMLSLKELGIRMGHDKLETLPFDPRKPLTDQQKIVIREYNKNDLDITDKILNQVKYNDVQLKRHLIESFNLPLEYFEKTDGVIAEELICDMYRKPVKRDIIRYAAPCKFNFKTKELQELLETYEGYWFTEEDKYKVNLSLWGINIEFGVGGLHACRSNYVGSNLVDIDVASYYPNIMKNFDLLPNTVRDKNEYYNMITERIAIKSTNKPLANAYKVVLNSVFGKLNYKRSKLYDLQALYAVTITGQLLIARLLEDLSLAGYTVIYINTDGLMIEPNEELGDKYLDICHAWENEFNFTLEYTHVNRAWLRDVSNYIVETEGKKGMEYKTKGDYEIKADRKNNAYHRIVWKAILEHLVNGTPIDEYIKSSTDINDFVMYVKYGSAYIDTKVIYYNGDTIPFDKAIRFYWATDQQNFITSKKEETDGVKNFGDAANIQIVKQISLVDELKNIDYDRYINRAYQKLGELLGIQIESNSYIESLLIRLPFTQDELSSGIGKKRSNLTLLSPQVTTINLSTGERTGYLVLDIDNPDSIGARKLQKLVDFDRDLVIYSSKYTLNDIKHGKCKYKVIYKHQGKDIPKKKKNVDVEVFYKHPIAIAGKRDDGYEYINNDMTPRHLHFDINDVLQESVPFKWLI